MSMTIFHVIYVVMGLAVAPLILKRLNKEAFDYMSGNIKYQNFDGFWSFCFSLVILLFWPVYVAITILWFGDGDTSEVPKW